MEEQNNEWMVNPSDQIQTSFTNSGTFHDSFSRYCCTNFPNVIPPLRNTSINRDQFSILQGTVEESARNNITWNNCLNNSNTIDLNFGGGANSSSYNLKESYEEFGTKRPQGLKTVKGPVPLHGQDHIIAERKRREKLNQRFIELSSVIPSLKKIDKASILVDAVVYIKELQQKVQNLEAQKSKPIESVVLVKNSCISSEASDPGCSSSESKPLPEIEVRLSGDKILISIHCESFKGVLMKLISELEEVNLTVTHANIMPFSRSTSFITIHAQMEEASNITADDVVRTLKSAFDIK